MLFRVAIICLIVAAARNSLAETPPEQAQAISELKGIPSNLQKNRDGTVRFVRFSKRIVTDEHVAKTVAFKQLDYLAVVTPNVGDAGLGHLDQLTNLDTLYLSDSGVTDATLALTGPLKKLERLYLDRTRVTDEGLGHLGRLESLTTLSLSETAVSDAGIRQLVGLEKLETLSLSKTSVTDNCLSTLAALPKLRVLDLNETTVTNRALGELANCPSLESLSLRGMKLDDGGLETFAKFQHLKHLDLRRSNLTAADISKFSASQPKLEVSYDPAAIASRNAFQRYLAGGQLQTANSETAKDGDQSKSRANRPIASRADQRFTSTNDEVPDFQRHIIPLFGRLGCNGRTCHGSFQGKGGFSLSLFGYDFDADLKAVKGGDEPRIDVDDVAASLILNKPTSEDDHGGGQRFKHDGWEYQLLKRWIAAGGRGGEGPPAKLLRFEVTPSEIVFQKTGETAQLKCVAVWEDGHREDVTPLTRFQSNDDTVADVSPDGLIACKNPGDTYVVAFYDNGIFSTQVLMPASDNTGDRFPPVESPTEIDRLIVRKLSRLGIVPSAVCSDEEFLRRVSLDMTGTLPSPDEVRRFLADPSPQKRINKVNELFKTDAYATWWAVQLADLTGSNSQALGSTDMNSPAAEQWNKWLQRRLKDNVGWDRIAAGIILANSRRPGQTYASYASEQSLHQKKADGTDYTDLNNPMHYYWFRSNNQTDTDRTLTFGYTFLGIRLQCAQCHKHPFDQWSRDDFEKFARVFKRIRTGIAPDGKDQQTFLKTKLGVPKKLDTAALRRQMYLRVSAEGLPIPWNEVWIEPPAEKPLSARILGGDEFNSNDFDDPREPLFAWMVEKNNPYFAPAFVNRVWAHYFGVGIVDPPDDFNMANPPTNKALLEWLSQQFIERGFDIKWLHRTIASSHAYQRSSVTTKTNRTDERNFSRSLVRRMPAEVTIDAILRATAADPVAAKYFVDTKTRKTGQHPRSFQARGIDYSLLVFGKPRRMTNCDCERQDQPTLLQSLYVRNDAEMIGWLERSDGWLKSVAKELGQPLSSEIKAGESKPTVASVFADDETTIKLIREAYLRTVTREPTPYELNVSKLHIASTENTVEGLRDLMWALLNTPEFLTNH